MTIEFANVCKSTKIQEGISELVLNDFTFRFELKNVITSIVAPFNSGKSTLLRLIAGLIKSDTGVIRIISGKENSESPKIIFIPTQPVSIPWLSVEENLKFGNEMNFDKDNLERILKVIELEDYRAHIPDKDSKGFRFRISFGRALLENPELIIIDESIEALEDLTKEEIIKMIRNAASSLNIKILFSTSNLLDALLVSNEIYFATGSPIKTFEKISYENSFKSFSELSGSNEIKSLLSNLSDKIIIQNGIII